MATPKNAGCPRNNEKFKQMYLYVLSNFENGVTNIKLAKLLYLSDFGYFYDNLKSISGVNYLRLDYGPVPDVFSSLTKDLQLEEVIKVTERPLRNDRKSQIVKSIVGKQPSNLLSRNEKNHIDKVCALWMKKRTNDIVRFTHRQKPWKTCLPGREIPYYTIIQEDPQHVYTPIAKR